MMEGNKEQRESFVAYRSFEKKKLPDELRLKYYDALFAYGLRQEVPDFHGDYVLESIWDSVTPQIDANLQRYLNGCKGGDYGHFGGAPKGNQNARKKQPQNNPKTTPNVNDNVNDNDNVNVKRFIVPTLQEVQNYCVSRQNNIDAAKFKDHYESVGWKIGKTPMKDWKAAVRTWERNQKENKSYQPQLMEPRPLSKEEW